jgi:hypothetical protein
VALGLKTSVLCWSLTEFHCWVVPNTAVCFIKVRRVRQRQWARWKSPIFVTFLGTDNYYVVFFCLFVFVVVICIWWLLLDDWVLKIKCVWMHIWKMNLRSFKGEISNDWSTLLPLPRRMTSGKNCPPPGSWVLPLGPCYPKSGFAHDRQALCYGLMMVFSLKFMLQPNP